MNVMLQVYIYTSYAEDKVLNQTLGGLELCMQKDSYQQNHSPRAISAKVQFQKNGESRTQVTQSLAVAHWHQRQQLKFNCQEEFLREHRNSSERGGLPKSNLECVKEEEMNTSIYILRTPSLNQTHALSLHL